MRALNMFSKLDPKMFFDGSRIHRRFIGQTQTDGEARAGGNILTIHGRSFRSGLRRIHHVLLAVHDVIIKRIFHIRSAIPGAE